MSKLYEVRHKLKVLNAPGSKPSSSRFEVGEITRTDIHQAEARLAGANADRIDSEGKLEASRAAYRNVVGQPAHRNLKAPAAPAGEPEIQAEANKAAVLGNSAVLSTEFERKALLDDVDEVRGELRPSVSLNFNLSRDWENTSNTNISREEAITSSVTIPLYQQDEVFSRLREAKQDVAEQLQAVDQARRDAVEDATRAWKSLVTVRAPVKAFKAQVGSRTVLDVLDAEQELLDSRVAHVSAQRDELGAVFELKAAMGQLTAKELKLPVKAYDPDDHYQKVRDKWFGGSPGGGE